MHWKKNSSLQHTLVALSKSCASYDLFWTHDHDAFFIGFIIFAFDLFRSWQLWYKNPKFLPLRILLRSPSSCGSTVPLSAIAPAPEQKLPPPKPGSLLWPPLRRPIFVSLNFLACRPFSIPDLPGFLVCPPLGAGVAPGRMVVVATEKALKRGTRWCHSQVGRSVRTLMIRGWKSGPTHHRNLKPGKPKRAGHSVC